MKAVEIKNLNYGYKSNWSFKRKNYIKDLNLDVKEGEAFGFLGPNGAGKTTTIKCLLGLIRAKSGEIRIFDQLSGDVNSRKMLGFLAERPYFYDHLKVRELLELYSVLKEISTKEVASEIARVLSLMSIEQFSGRKLKNLSKGQVQRVAMAQALLGNPKLLVLDEPFSGLDPIGRKEFADLLVSLKKQGVTILICSHILSDIEILCDRVGIMCAGKLGGVFDLKDLPHGGLEELFIRTVEQCKK